LDEKGNITLASPQSASDKVYGQEHASRVLLTSILDDDLRIHKSLSRKILFKFFS
jgi:hypothetical protein